MPDRMTRLAELPIRTSTDFIAQDGEDDTVVVEGEVVDFLLDGNDRLTEERNRLRAALVEWLEADQPVAGVTYTRRGAFGRDREDIDAEQAQRDRIHEAKRRAREAAGLEP